MKISESVLSSPVAVFGLTIILAFGLQLLFPDVSLILSLNSDTALQEPWQFISSIFLHSGVAHLFSNLIALVYFGFLLESIISKKDFFIVFIFGGLASSLISFFAYPSAVGASGAIYALIGCLAALRPLMFVLAFSVPLPMVLTATAYLLVDLVGVFVPSNTAHFGHIGGLVFGTVFGLFLRKSYPKLKKSKNDLKVSDEEFRKWEDKYMFRK